MNLMVLQIINTCDCDFSNEYVGDPSLTCEMSDNKVAIFQEIDHRQYTNTQMFWDNLKPNKVLTLTQSRWCNHISYLTNLISCAASPPPYIQGFCSWSTPPPCGGGGGWDTEGGEGRGASQQASKVGKHFQWQVWANQRSTCSLVFSPCRLGMLEKYQW